MTRAALILFLLGLCVPVWAEETRTFEDDNLAWTLPDGWSFHKVSRMQANAGFLVTASSDGVAAELTCAAFEAQEGATLDKLLGDLAEWGKSRLRNARTTKTGPAKLSGIDGKVAVVAGEVMDGTPAHYRYYAVRKDAHFYVLMMQTWDGDHRKHTRALDAVRRGLRLVEGSGPEEQPLEGFGDLGADVTPEPDTSGGPVWSETSPQKDGSTIVFPSHNLRWTLPETPFEVTYVTQDEPQTGQAFLVFEAARQRRVPRDDAANACKLRLTIETKPPGFDAAKLIRDEAWQDAKAAGLKERLAKAVTFKDGIALGNATASYVQIRGKVAADFQTLAYYVVSVRDRIYTWHAMATGEERVYTLFRGEIERLLKGAVFPNTNTGLPGPIAGAVPTQVEPRGSDAERAVGFELPGAKVVKPAGPAVVVGPGSESPAAFAFEGRTANESAYLYVEVLVAACQAQMAERQSKSLAAGRAKSWKQALGPTAKAGAPTPDRWAGTPCLTARRTGQRDGVTYTERSWWIPRGDRLYVVRVQYGGDAERTLGAVFAAFRKSWQFEN